MVEKDKETKLATEARQGKARQGKSRQCTQASKQQGTQWQGRALQEKASWQGTQQQAMKQFFRSHSPSVANHVTAATYYPATRQVQLADGMAHLVTPPRPALQAAIA